MAVEPSTVDSLHCCASSFMSGFLHGFVSKLGDKSIIQIRPAVVTDANQIATAHVDSIRSLGAKVYGPDVISAWRTPRDGERYRRAMGDRELFFLAISSDDNERLLRSLPIGSRRGSIEPRFTCAVMPRV